MRQPKKTFDEFVDEYLVKTGSKASLTEPVLNTTYAYFEKIIALVVSDIESKNEYSDQKWYQEYKPQIRRMLKAAVITTIWATGVTESD